MHLPSQRSVPVFVLALSALGFTPALAAQTTRLTPNAAPSGASIRVQPGFAPDPSTTGVTGGGAVEHPGCGGFVSPRPQLVITVGADLPWMRVFAASAVDTTIAVLGPAGQWRCADDTYGINPSVDGRFRRGTYRVWVGTPTAGTAASASVTVTGQRAQRPVEGPTAIVSTPVQGHAQDPLGAATGLAQQVLGGFGGPSANPLAVPLTTLTRAGLSPNGLPTALDSVLRQPDAGVANLNPAQLTQLAELARAGLTAEQLQSVTGALTGARGAHPTLSPTQLTQLGELARGGMNPTQLQSQVSSMLRGVGAAR